VGGGEKASGAVTVRRIYDGKRFALEKRSVAGADGRVHEHEIIVHPGAAVILPLLDDGRIVMVSNVRPAAGATLLELPAGTIDPPESPRECAERELTEETGYRASSLAPLVSFFASPGICTEKMHVFVARGLAAGPQELDAGEQIETRIMEYDELLAAVRDGRIVDGKTIAALLYFDRFARG
jgi:ADP-ribose pyrophosphatase